MEKFDLPRLEASIEELVQKCLQLAEENQALHQQQESLLAERSLLIEKNSLARIRIEAMITRLKALEMDSSYE